MQWRKVRRIASSQSPSGLIGKWSPCKMRWLLSLKKTMGLSARAAVSVLANLSAFGVRTSPKLTLGITCQATVVDAGRLRAGRLTSSRLHDRDRPNSGEGLHWATERIDCRVASRRGWLNHYALEENVELSTWFAHFFEERGVLLHRWLHGFLMTKSDRVGADEREEDCRRPDRDNDEVENFNLI